MIEIYGSPLEPFIELNQWDTGRSVRISGIEAECVHFANKGDSRAVIMAVENMVSKIPDFLLQTGKQLCVYAVKNGVTLESKTFYVKKRERPENYVYEDDQRNYIYELIQNAQTAADNATAVAQELREAKDSGELKGDPGEPATDDQVAAAVEAYMEEHPVEVPDVDMTGVVKSVNGISPDENGNVEIAGGTGGGISATEKNLMLALFKAIPYKSDVSATMKSLEAIWSGSGGDTPDVPDVPAVTYYSVAYNLTNITADNNTASVIEGGSLTVNLTPDTNAVMGEVIVTMGGVDVTATAYSNGKISISSVTGNVAITATATVANYTQVEYLESSNKAWIYAPYGIGATDLVEATFYLANTNWSAVWDSYQNTMRHALRIRKGSNYISLTRRKAAAWNTYSPGVEDFTFPTTKVKFVETEVGKGTLYDADGNILYQTLEDTEVSTFTGTNQIVMFSMSSSGTNGLEPASGIKICEFIIKDVYGTVKRHFIPVLDENDVPCMYEKVSGEYFYNTSDVEGSAFIAGGAV